MRGAVEAMGRVWPSSPGPAGTAEDQAAAASSAIRLGNIQAMRALAALMVLVAHVSGEWALVGASRGMGGLARFDAGGAGVDLFFVISGFIMVVTTVPRWDAPGHARRFAARRVTRIVPLYWTLTSVLLAGSLAAPSLLHVPIEGLRQVLASYLFWPSLRPDGEVRPILAVGWTLNYEMGFYAIFTLALLLPLRGGLCFGAAVLLGLVALGQVAGPQATAAAFWTSPILLEFVLGGAAGLVYLSGVRLAKVPGSLLAALGLAALLSSGDLVEHRDGLLATCALGLPAVMVVLAAACGPQGHSGRLSAGLRALGDASYSLYLVHPFLIRPITALWLKAPLLPTWGYAPVALTVATVAGYAVHRWIERPLTVRAARLLG